MTIAEKYALNTLLKIKDEAINKGLSIGDTKLSPDEVDLVANVIDFYISDYKSYEVRGDAYGDI